jgi:hypothetical protein
MTLAQGSCNRMVQKRFQHSGETIYRHFHKILKALNLMVMDLIKPSNPTFNEVPKKNCTIQCIGHILRYLFYLFINIAQFVLTSC